MKYVIAHNSDDYGNGILRLKSKYESYISNLAKADSIIEFFGFDDMDTSGGSVALDGNGNVAAWLKIEENAHEVWGDFIRIQVLYDIDLEKHGSVIKKMYGIEIDKIDKPYYEHKVFCPGFDADLLRIWFELGFGMEQAYGYAKLNDMKANLTPDNSVKIEELKKDNQNDFTQFYSLIAACQAQAPTFAGAPESYLLSLKEGFKELIDDEEEKGFLAFSNDKAVGYQVWSMEEGEVAELTVSGTKVEERGKGIGTALTAYGVDRAMERGYTYCIADWRTANPYSSSFWPAIGLTPYIYRLVRRLSKTALDDSKRIKANFA